VKDLWRKDTKKEEEKKRKGGRGKGEKVEMLGQ